MADSIYNYIASLPDKRVSIAFKNIFERFIPSATEFTNTSLVDIGAVTATAAEINRVCDASSRMVAGGSTLTLTEATHDGKIIKLDTAAGTTITLPAASGSGATFRFCITTIATSNSHVIKVANSSDTMIGMIMAVSDDAGFPVKGYTADATAGADTITLNRSTTGSTVKGEWIEIIDVATNKFKVTGFIAATGTEATPFSATV